MNINDIAKLANVSKATVSRVINDTGQVSEKTRRKVLEVMEKYNYHPNSFAQAISAQSHQSGYIAVVIPHSEAYIMSNPVYAELFQGVADVLGPAGFFMLSCFTSDEDYIKKLYYQKRVDGFIILSPTDNEYSLLHSLYTIGAPFLSTTSFDFSEGAKYFHVPYVDIDNYRAAGLAMEHLLSLGHKKIGFLSTHANTSRQGKLASILLRQKAYEDALTAQGICPDPRLMAVAPINGISEGYNAMTSLLRSGSEPTAVFCSTDLLAIGALKAAKDRGLSVPKDLSLIGFDGIPWTGFTDPPLTTIRQESYARGSKIAKKLVDFLQDGILITDELCEAELIPGESTAPPN